MRIPALVVLGGLLAGCGPDDTAELPRPEPLTAEATGVFCHMTIAEHSGPMAQLFVADHEGALWFPSVRDLFTYLHLPDVRGRAIGAWVSDTARLGPAGDIAEDGWIDARAAVYVVDSAYTGGMGRSEAVPFAELAAARAFVAAEGGRIVRFEEIDAAWVAGDGSPAGEGA